jgi:hypothetical protein
VSSTRQAADLELLRGELSSPFRVGLGDWVLHGGLGSKRRCSEEARVRCRLGGKIERGNGSGRGGDDGIRAVPDCSPSAAHEHSAGRW